MTSWSHQVYYNDKIITKAQELAVIWPPNASSLVPNLADAACCHFVSHPPAGKDYMLVMVQDPTLA